jgi:hypothetical protein
MMDAVVIVTDHAYWRAAERFPHFDTVTIDHEVREAIDAGRLSAEREHLGLHHRADPTCLYAWTLDGARIYALRHDERPPQWVVTTTMRPEDAA